MKSNKKQVGGRGQFKSQSIIIVGIDERKRNKIEQDRNYEYCDKNAIQNLKNIAKKLEDI